MEQGTLVGARFEIQRLLGAGGQGRTWLARDVLGQELVALKELSLSTADSWKAVELFEREGRALEALDHPLIPDYVKAFTERETDGSTRFFLAQEYVEGASLEEELATTQWGEVEAISLCRELLQVLVMLHGRSPPVVHRDIKPSNLLRRASDGRVVLIDFGAVQTVATGAEGGSTVVGTAGYMPLEQYMGKAVPASDLYAVGATLVRLLSKRQPTDLPLVRSRIVFEDAVNVTPRFASVLRKLLAPNVEDRYQRAEEALEDLAVPATPEPPAPTPVAVVATQTSRVQTSGGRIAVGHAPDPDAPGIVVPGRTGGPLARVRRYLAITSVAAVFGGLGQTCMFFQPRGCGGGVDPIIAAVEACPAAREALGPGVEQAFLGVSCVHNSESQGDCSAESWHGHAAGTVTLKGARSRGRVSFFQRMDGCSNWDVASATLTVGDEEIRLVPCL